MSQVKEGSAAAGWQRWIILSFLFFATTLNYVDRLTLGVLKPVLSGEFHWSEIDYSHIVFWFTAAYAIGYFIFGRAIDWLGAKLGYSIAVIIWTAAHLACALVGSATGFSIMLFALGLGQSGNFPAALKAVAEWFPKRERALANGIFNAGTNVGAVITPLLVPIITLAYGWRVAFIATGSLSAIWLVLWLVRYRDPRQDRNVSPAELAHIESDKPLPETRVPWLRLLAVRETWAFALGKFLTDPVSWFYQFWLPAFFVKKYGLDIKSFGPPIIVIYLMSDVGSVAGGWLSSTLIKHGVSLNFARKLAMLICAVCVLPVAFSGIIAQEWIVVVLVGLAAAAHQGFSANLWAIPADTMPRTAVASVVGIGGTAGAIGGMVIATVVGLVLALTNSYSLIFAMIPAMYFIALGVAHLLAPRLAPAKLGA